MIKSGWTSSSFIPLLLIGISLFYSCMGTEKNGIKGNNNNGNSIIIGDNNVVITDGKNRIPDSISIVGAWDQKRADHLVLEILNNDFDSTANNYSHEILKFYNLDYTDKEAIIAVTFSRTKRVMKDGMDVSSGACHACGGKMSFIEFVHYANGWRIEGKYIRTLEWGQWGEPDADWKLLNIGYHKFGFVTEGCGTGQGWTECSTHIFTWMAGEFKEILDVATAADNSGTGDATRTDYGTVIDVIKQGTGFYDLNVITKGIKDSAPFKEINYYKFDGANYSVSNTFK